MLHAARHFQTTGNPISSEPYGNGHINQTYLVITDTGTWYILQKINHHVFRNVPQLMENITGVTRFLAQSDPDPRHVLTVVRTREGQDFLRLEDGYWRMYIFVTDSISLDLPESPTDFYHSALAFGRFQTQLKDYSAATLHETIPHFHNTPVRYARLIEAIEKDALGRAKTARDEIHFARELAQETSRLTSLQAEGRLPLRVTHNDTKLNNVMLDHKTRAPLCVIDLDTVMPGLAANDFGDSIRFGASTAAEDERDLSKVSMSLPLFATYTKGFLAACRETLWEEEIRTLPLGAMLMTLECGLRFLSDYLEGDQYFHIKRPDHNLDRCRTQFKLVRDMQAKWSDMQAIVEKEASA